MSGVSVAGGGDEDDDDDDVRGDKNVHKIHTHKAPIDTTKGATSGSHNRHSPKQLFATSCSHTTDTRTPSQPTQQ